MTKSQDTGWISVDVSTPLSPHWLPAPNARAVKVAVSFDRRRFLGTAETAFLSRVISDLARISAESEILLLVRIPWEAEEFEHSFVGLICLAAALLPNLVTTVDFSVADEAKAPPRIFYMFLQSSLTGQTMSGRLPFSVQLNAREYPLRRERIESASYSSLAFLPIFQIYEGSYESLFKTPLKEIVRKAYSRNIDTRDLERTLVPKDETLGDWEQRVARELRQTIAALAARSFSPDTPQLLHQYSGLMSLISGCRACHALPALVEAIFQNLHIGDELEDAVKRSARRSGKSTGLRDGLQYQEQTRSRVQYLFDQPSFLGYLFGLVANVVLPAQRAADSKDELVPVARLDQTIDFCSDVFAGLREIAKNVVEHSSSRQGVLTIRVYSKSQATKGRWTLARESLKRKQAHAVVDISLLDGSEIGITESTERHLSELAAKYHGYPGGDVFRQDLERVKTGGIRLGDFFDVRRPPLLHQQFRAAASLGLLIFSDLLERNGGFVVVSSPSKRSIERASAGAAPRDLEMFSFDLGTRYSAVFPLLKRGLPETRRASVNPGVHSLSEALIEVGRMNSQALSSLAGGDLASSPRRVLITTTWPEYRRFFAGGKTRQISGWRRFFEKSPLALLAIDLSESTDAQDPSVLFRVMAELQLALAPRALVVYGIDEPVVLRVQEILKLYETAGKAVWNAEDFVALYYSAQSPVGPYSQTELFVLGGETIGELVAINQMSTRDYPSREILGEVSVEESVRERIKAAMKACPLFARNGAVLPFDVVLPAGRSTLFLRGVEEALCAGRN